MPPPPTCTVYVYVGGGRIELHNLHGGKAIDPSKFTTNSLPGVGFGGKTCGVHVTVVALGHKIG